MARFSKLEVLSTMISTGMVPVFYNADLEITKKIVKACYDGGVRVFEFTNRGDFAQEVFSELSKYVATECKDMILGIGSVVDAPTAAIYIQMGANFVVSPLMNSEIAKLCNRRGIPYSPGCATMTEINNAQELGCDLCKIFPASTLGGSSFIKSIKAPMPWAMLIVTGGVEPTEENLTSWFKAGVSCVGMGSNLFPASAIKNEDWTEISSLCEKCFEYIAKARQK